MGVEKRQRKAFGGVDSIPSSSVVTPVPEEVESTRGNEMSKREEIQKAIENARRIANENAYKAVPVNVEEERREEGPHATRSTSVSRARTPTRRLASSHWETPAM